MTQADFSYGVVEGKTRSRSLSIFVDRPHLRQQVREDAEAAGFHVRRAAPLEELLEAPPLSLGEAIIIDCPLLDENALAALAKADRESAVTGAQLIVSTAIGSLDEVFAGFEQSEPQFLVDPSHADRVIALGRVLATGGAGHVREMSNQDQLMLLRLTEQVGQIAARLEAFGAPQGVMLPGIAGAPESGGAGLPDGPAIAFDGEGDAGTDRLIRNSRPPLPDPRLVRRIIRHRQMRAKFIGGDLFADPAWDILLDLTAARAGESPRVRVFSVHRGGRATDHRLALDHPDDRGGFAGAGGGRSGSPPRLHRSRGQHRGFHHSIFRGTGPQRRSARLTGFLGRERRRRSRLWCSGETGCN